MLFVPEGIGTPPLWTFSTTSSVKPVAPQRDGAPDAVLNGVPHEIGQHLSKPVAVPLTAKIAARCELDDAARVGGLSFEHHFLTQLP